MKTKIKKLRLPDVTVGLVGLGALGGLGGPGGSVGLGGPEGLSLEAQGARGPWA